MTSRRDPTTTCDKLVSESPLLVLPTLAVAVGLTRAVVLQQIQFWLSVNKQRERDLSKNNSFKDGKFWSYNTWKEWEAEFPWMDSESIGKILADLRKRNLVLATDKYNNDRCDRTLWYSVNYDALNELLSDESAWDVTKKRAAAKKSAQSRKAGKRHEAPPPCVPDEAGSADDCF